MNRTIRILLAALTVAGLGLATVQAQGFAPRNVECIAPAGAGGGWDMICRQISDILVQLDLVPGAIRTQNLVGAGGGVAYASVVNNQRGNPNVIVAASTATTSRLAGGQFAGYTADDVRWIATVGADYGVLAVSPDSAFRNLEDVINAWNVDPSLVSTVGGSAVGGWDHLKVLLLADAAGIPVQQVRYTAFDGGGLAVIEILAGRADVFSGDVSEVLPQIEAGNLRVLTVLAPERQEGLLADVPTAMELGYDVVGSNWRGWYMPPGIGDEAYDWWTDAFRQLAASPQWQELRPQLGLARFELFGDDMEAFAKDQVEDITKLLRSIGALQ
ncbi:MAG: Bug family tripartite tricarboxylate transporter substrate binding protein [Trueperaceae bacterium]